MRKLYGMIALMSLLASLAGIGSFFVAVVQHFSVNEQYSQAPSPPPPPPDQPPAVADPPVKRVCNLVPYEQKARQLRESYVRAPQTPLPAYVWLGADTEFEYFYDFGPDVVFCRRRANPGGPLVSSGGPARDPNAERRRLIVLLIVTAASCAGLLHLIQSVRSRRRDRR